MEQALGLVTTFATLYYKRMHTNSSGFPFRMDKLKADAAVSCVIIRQSSERMF